MTNDEDIKKDLKGRQKKIEKLIAENYVLTNRLEVAEDNLNDERSKNVRLYSRYICALKELAQYKKNDNEVINKINKIRNGDINESKTIKEGYWIYSPKHKGTEKLICSNCGKANHCKPKPYCFECGSKNTNIIKS